MQSRHAYLIVAHNDFDVLKKLILLLDNSRNDIYVHIDKKVVDFDFESFRNLATESSIFFIERLEVSWGDYSLIACEIALLKAAIPKKYSYYHLLSGVDLPLKTNDEIHAFFDKYQGKEFLHFDGNIVPESVVNRIRHYHVMTGPALVRKAVNKILTLFHRVTGYKRKWDKHITIQKGANWFSITHSLAEYVVDRTPWIKKYFRFSSCADEIFLHTIVYNSQFRENLYYSGMDNNYIACMRYIDWDRGSPYVFRSSDYNLLMQSEYLFARKFSTSVDSQIITNIYEYLSLENKKLKNG